MRRIAVGLMCALPEVGCYNGPASDEAHTGDTVILDDNDGPGSTTTVAESSDTATSTGVSSGTETSAGTGTDATNETGDSAESSETGDSCALPEILCRSQCIDPASDNRFCGARDDCTGVNAGQACTTGVETCIQGSCECLPSCDEAKCGMDPVCGTQDCGSCDLDQVCSGGVCENSCRTGEVFCGNECIDPDVHQTFCGASGSCNGSDAGQHCSKREVCEAGTCVTKLDWSPSIFISKSTGIGDASSPRVSVAPDATITAVWKQHDDTTEDSSRSIWSNRYEPKTRSWGAPTLVETAGGDADRPDVIVDADGHAMAVWNQFNGDRVQIWSSRLAPNSTFWSSPEAVENLASGDSSFSEKNLTVDSSGVVTVIWTHKPIGSHRDLWSNRFDPRVGRWGIPTLVENDSDNRSYGGTLAVNTAGRATFAWAQDTDDFSKAIQVAHFAQSASQWSTAYNLHGRPDLKGNTIALAISGNDTATAVWSSYGQDANDNQIIDLWWSQMNGSTLSWSSPKLFEHSTGDARFPELLTDSGGNVICAWRQHDGDATRLWSSRLSQDSATWSSPLLVGPKSLGDAHRHRIAMDAEDGINAVWSTKSGDHYDLWTTRKVPGSSSWSEPVQLESEDGGSAFIGNLSVDANGDVTVVWRQDNKSRQDIMSARFEPQR